MATMKRFCASLVAALSWLTPAVASETEIPSLQAAMAYNLLAFAEWPAAALPSSTEFTLCLLSEDDEVMRAFTRMAGRTLKGRTLTVNRRQPLANLSGCQAIYFDRIAAGLVADKIAALHEQPVLTMAMDSGERCGAMIGLRVTRNRLGFAVDAAALRAAGITLPARVLELAKTVYR